MGKIVYLMGKSSSGKDTIYKKLLKQNEIIFRTLPLYTTRPIRAGEQDGVEYCFTDNEGYLDLKNQGRIIEERTYQTTQGDWKYFTVWNEKLDLTKYNYLMIGTLESYMQTREWIGKENIVPVYIVLDDGERLQRALTRERFQECPQYEEMCRRFLADAKDFSEDKISEAEIAVRFWNGELERCLNEIMKYLRTETER